MCSCSISANERATPESMLICVQWLKNVRWQEFREDHVVRTENRRVLDGILQFSNIAGPPILQQEIQAIRVQTQIRQSRDAENTVSHNGAPTEGCPAVAHEAVESQYGRPASGSTGLRENGRLQWLGSSPDWWPR